MERERGESEGGLRHVEKERERERERERDRERERERERERGGGGEGENIYRGIREQQRDGIGKRKGRE